VSGRPYRVFECRILDNFPRFDDISRRYSCTLWQFFFLSVSSNWPEHEEPKNKRQMRNQSFRLVAAYSHLHVQCFVPRSLVNETIIVVASESCALDPAKPANPAVYHSLPLLRANLRVSYVVAGANERQLNSQANFKLVFG